MIAIETRYLGPTNTKPARIIAETCNGQRLVRSADDLTHHAVAKELAQRMGWLDDGSYLVEGATKRGMVYVFHKDD